MKITIIIVRSLMGLLFLMSSVGFFLNLFPQPVLEGNLLTFNKGVEASGYLMTLIKATELIAGIAFLSGRFVRIAAVVIFPVIVNIFMVSLMLAPEGLPVAIFLVLADLFIAFYYRKDYAPMMVAK
ncbi:MAG TPA: DoxX family membrane protein [Cyclobacteriaceae bacterium]|nr:DoxX family membrane protein [Cyclobacteriaceae bacterium]